jgi:hypothetical protein
MKDLTADTFSSTKPSLLFALHDVTPFHLDRIRRAEEFFHRWGIEKASYLLVPDYHGDYQLKPQTAFEDWIRNSHPVAVEWLLHGYYHLEMGHKEMPSAPGGRSSDLVRAQSDSMIQRWIRMGKRRLLTAGEGEFVDLAPAEIERRLDRGLECFKKLTGDALPPGFIAPAWLYNKHLVPLLKQRTVLWTENHHGLVWVEEDQLFSVPVITWATRTPGRLIGSLLVCPIQLRLWLQRPLIRIAVHPFDFEHAATIRSIENVVKRALEVRETLAYKDLAPGRF